MNSLVSQGVEQLILQLREEGVNSGREHAEKTIAEARLQATAILEEAIANAEAIVTQANRSAEAEVLAGQNALNLAARDLYLEFQEVLTQQFSREAQKLVADTLLDTKLIQQIIMALCSKSINELDNINTNDMQILFAKDSPQVKQLVDYLNKQALTSGIRFGTISDAKSGIYVLLDNGKIKVEFTEKSLAQALLAHLQPRFKELIEGILA